MFQFNLSPLVSARPGKRLGFSLDEGPQRLDDIDVAFLNGQMQFTRIQDGILVETQIQTEITVGCTRCLSLLSHPTTLEVEEIVGFAGQLRVDTTYYLCEDGWLDVLPLLREQVWVNMPMKPLCQPDCRGICPECGTDLNLESCQCQENYVNPRLAALAEFYTESE